MDLFVKLDFFPFRHLEIMILKKNNYFVLKSHIMNSSESTWTGSAGR
jgi:hypothetical protein